MSEQFKDLKQHINNSPDLLSFLYDLNLLPEQLQFPSLDGNRMIIITLMHKYGVLSLSSNSEIKATLPKPTRPKLTEEQFQAFLRGFDQADQELSSNSKPTPPEQ